MDTQFATPFTRHSAPSAKLRNPKQLPFEPMVGEQDLGLQITIRIHMHCGKTYVLGHMTCVQKFNVCLAHHSKVAFQFMCGQARAR